MKKSCRYPGTLPLIAFTLALATLSPGLFAQSSTQPASRSPAATAPSTAPTAAPIAAASARNVDALLPANKVKLDFSNEPIASVTASIAKSFNLRLIDPYKLPQTITMKLKDPLSAREAIDVLDQTLLQLGYTVQREVVGEPPVVQLRIVPASQQPGLRVFNGIDPAQIPDNDELRTQVIPLAHIEPEKARQLVVPVLDQRADITVNAGSHTLIITDTNSRIRTAVTLLQVLEKQAAEKSPAPPPATAPAPPAPR